MTTLHLKKSIGTSPWRCGFLLLVFACFVLSPAAHALLPPPPPDGGYPNQNTAEGDNALFNLTSGPNNTAVGFDGLFSNTTGSNNTAFGAFALLSNTNGGGNVAAGLSALRFNTTGNGNVAIGSFALQNNTTGLNNTAIGNIALLSNTTAGFNTATGAGALANNTTGPNNTANGWNALSMNTSGSDNTAVGFEALFANTTGGNNTAYGYQALLNNTTAANNTAVGLNALINNQTGSNNIALGVSAGSSLTNGSNNIDIGALGAAGEANKIRIGRQGTQNGTFIAGIFGVAVTGSQVVVTANGKLGVAASSARFKEAIKPMDKASEAILALKPVTFRYKEELDPNHVPQFGLIAEQVEKVNPDLVVRDEDRKVNAVRYEAVNAMLLNEFLKEHRKVAQLEQQVERLTAGLQKVSAQLEASKSAPQVVNNT